MKKKAKKISNKDFFAEVLATLLGIAIIVVLLMLEGYLVCWLFNIFGHPLPLEGKWDYALLGLAIDSLVGIIRGIFSK